MSTSNTQGALAKTVIVALLAATIAMASGSSVSAAPATSAAAKAAEALVVGPPYPPGPGSLSGGGAHFCVHTLTGSLKCWGFNGTGTLGDRTTIDRLTAVQVPGDSATTLTASMDAGGQTTCAVTVVGGARCWGNNGDGQVGDGSTTNRLSPVYVSGLTTGVKAITVGYYHACALTTGGGVKCWGANNAGQLGNGSTTPSTTPVDVSGLGSGVVAIAAGLDDTHRDHTCALTTSGGVKCWGANSEGQLGNGTTTASSTPVDVVGLDHGVASIYAGGMHTCAITVGGGAKCWGDNNTGQLGDGTNIRRLTPVDVAGLTSGVTTMALSQSSSLYGYRRSHTCAATDAGEVKCWGRNDDGQAGNGTVGGDRSTPTDVPGVRDVVGIATTFAAVCTVSAGGAVKCWGGNNVGDGTSLQRTRPVDIVQAFFRGECGVIVPKAHTAFTLSDDYAVGSVATFAADPGYTLIGATTATCEAGGRWTSPPPIAAGGGVPTMTPGGVSTAEANSGTRELQVPVVLSQPSATTVSASWTTLFVDGAPAGQADPASDYTPTSGTVTFAPGVTAATAVVTVTGDLLVEPDEYVVVSFTNPIGARMGGFWGLGFGTIENDDATIATPGSATLTEGDEATTTLEVPVTLSQASASTVEVSWTTLFVAGAAGDQADPASDYAPASGTVTFAPGETSATVPIEVGGDGLVEPDEYVVVSFTDPVGARMGGFWGLGFGGILNDD